MNSLNLLLYPSIVFLFNIFIYVLPQALGSDVNDNVPRVVTPWATYLGSEHKSGRQRRIVKAFTGIPYAKAPIGELRFRPPEPFPSPTPIFNATGSSPECLQFDYLLGRGVHGKEDCLYLNVYTNSIPPPPKYPNTQPTVVFLHAGTWLAGGGASDIFTPDYLIESDVTIVTINHRLGPLGFLSTEDTEAPGNLGLLDTVKALEWVRDNVRYFGGMNDSITVMGSGAGGIAAHMLTLSPLTRGLYTKPDENSLLHRAISQSGTAYSPHALVKNPLQKAKLLASKLQCPTEDSRAMISCLRGLEGSKIVDQMLHLFEWDEEPLPFGPVVDYKWNGDKAFLPDEPHHLIRRNSFLHVPWIIGSNKNDGAFRVQDILKDSSLVSQLNNNWDKYGPILLNLKDSCKNPVAISKQIKQYYMGKQKFGEHSSTAFIEMMTDRFFLYPTDQAAKDHCFRLRGHKNFCYRYELQYSGRKSFLDVIHSTSPQEAASAAFGVRSSNPRFQNTRDAHGLGVSFLDELLYLFPSPKVDLAYKNEFMGADDAAHVSTVMVLLWTNFIKGSDPTPVMQGFPEDTSPWGTWWEPYINGYYYYLPIDPKMESEEVPLHQERMAFWDGLPLFDNRDHNIIRDEL